MSVRSKVDLSNIVAVLVTTTSPTGRVWIFDIATSQAQIRQPVVLDLPVISVNSFTVSEGKGPKNVVLNITANKALKSPGAIWVQKNENEGYQVDLIPGSSTLIAKFPFSWIGDSLFSYSSTTFDTMAVSAIKGVVTGNYIGAINVLEDDPIPKLRVVAANVTAKEGMSFEWQLRLSEPTTGFDFNCYLVPPGGKELTSRDVPNSWLQQWYGSPPSTPVPLSSLGVNIQVQFPYGVQSASLIVPIVGDSKEEGNELLACESFDFETGQVLTLVGTVPRHS
jgi:hypothetical protein